jgi:hypothetical protein
MAMLTTLSSTNSSQVCGCTHITEIQTPLAPRMQSLSSNHVYLDSVQNKNVVQQQSIAVTRIAGQTGDSMCVCMRRQQSSVYA